MSGESDDSYDSSDPLEPVKRKFSLLKLIKTPLRNKLAPDTISCLMQVHRYIPNIDTWDVPESLVKNVGDWKSILKEK